MAGRFWEKGGAWVAAQAFLLLAGASLPWVLGDQLAWPGNPPAAAGWVASAGGAALLAAGALRLGRGLTPLPAPSSDGALQTEGVYSLVRHPIYAGVILLALGWALGSASWGVLAFPLALLIFFDLKSRREEEWLVQRWPEYREYRRRVKKLIPGLY